MLLVLSFWFFETKKNLFGFSFACSMKYSPKARILNARPIHVLSYDWLKINQSNDSIWIPMWKLFFENDGGTFDRLWCSKAADCQQISWCWWTRSRSMESCFCQGKPLNSHTAFKGIFVPDLRWANLERYRSKKSWTVSKPFNLNGKGKTAIFLSNSCFSH